MCLDCGVGLWVVFCEGGHVRDLYLDGVWALSIKSFMKIILLNESFLPIWTFMPMASQIFA